MSTDFPSGLVVFFRVPAEDNKTLARSIHKDARTICIGKYSGHSFVHDDDYVVLGEDDRFLGCYPREFVSAILPLATVGPSNADN